MPVDVFAGMNPEQREAIAHLKGPMLVVAGAWATLDTHQSGATLDTHQSER